MPKFIKLAQAKSTNSYMMAVAATLPGGTVIYTPRQTAGRGQKGNSWESEDGKNLAFSYLLKQPAIEAKQQFYISEAVSLAVLDFLSRYTPHVAIKWPNDIYHKDSKMCGMLIENSLDGKNIAHSIIGIGININQEKFLSDAPNPISLKNVTGIDYDLEELLRDVCGRIEQLCNFAHMQGSDFEQLHERYLAHLYRADGRLHTWQLPDGTRFRAILANVAPDGMLSLQCEHDDEVKTFAFKEVKHVIGSVDL